MKNTDVKIHVCPITRVAKLLSDTWTMLIMHAFLNDPESPEKRFCELERALSGISTRTLTNKLKTLESEGLLEKTDAGTYRITKRGTGLQIIEDSMRMYEQKFLQ